LGIQENIACDRPSSTGTFCCCTRKSLFVWFVCSVCSGTERVRGVIIFRQLSTEMFPHSHTLCASFPCWLVCVFPSNFEFRRATTRTAVPEREEAIVRGVAALGDGDSNLGKTNDERTNERKQVGECPARGLKTLTHDGGHELTGRRSGSSSMNSRMCAVCVCVCMCVCMCV